jgi:hypothetical protein
MTESYEISNPRWLKFLLTTSIVVFGLAPGCLLCLSVRADGLRAILLALAACFFAWLFWAGLRLIRFINHNLVMVGETVTITRGASSTTFAMQELRIGVSEALQIIDVIDRNGRLVFSADYYATNAAKLRQLARSNRFCEQ